MIMLLIIIIIMLRIHAALLFRLSRLILVLFFSPYYFKQKLSLLHLFLCVEHHHSLIAMLGPFVGEDMRLIITYIYTIIITYQNIVILLER